MQDGKVLFLDIIKNTLIKLKKLIQNKIYACIGPCIGKKVMKLI